MGKKIIATSHHHHVSKVYSPHSNTCFGSSICFLAHKTYERASEINNAISLKIQHNTITAPELLLSGYTPFRSRSKSPQKQLLFYKKTSPMFNSKDFSSIKNWVSSQLTESLEPNRYLLYFKMPNGSLYPSHTIAFKPARHGMIAFFDPLKPNAKLIPSKMLSQYISEVLYDAYLANHYTPYSNILLFSFEEPRISVSLPKIQTAPTSLTITGRRINSYTKTHQTTSFPAMSKYSN